jgi:hypothetical protein
MPRQIRELFALTLILKRQGISTAVRNQSKIGGEEVVRPGRSEIGQLFPADFLLDQVPFTSLLFVFLLRYFLPF